MATLQFKGKSAVWNHHLSVPYHTLEKDGKKSLEGENDSENLIIEGDNLLALKALLPKYQGKIKCIYIDPPYNTGNENWVYSDNVSSPTIREWVGKVVGKEGEDLSRHDKWLCMMTPRLKLLRDLLTNDGVIFVSIDNNEVYYLRALMNEVFGSGNFIGMIANVNNPKGRSDDKYVATAHEYLLIYKREYEPLLFGWKPEENVLRRYRNVASDGRLWREIDLRKTGEGDRREDRPKMFYYFLYNEKTKELRPTKDKVVPDGFIQIKPLRADEVEGRWRWEIDTALNNLDRLYARYMPNRKVWSVFEMDYLDPNERITPTSAWTKKDFNSERGTEQFIDLGFEKEDFPKPKPVGLIRHILEFATKDNDVVLDSFAGSGTTSHAVMAQNKEDGGNRKFILVEMEDYVNTITAERVRRAVKRDGYKIGFTYYKLGQAIDAESILSGKLPSYEEFAKYVFYLATGENHPDEKKIREKDFFVGKTDHTSVYLIYEQNTEALKKIAITLDWAQQTQKKDEGKKIVYAPACYLDDEALEQFNIAFVSIPYNLFEQTP